MTHTGRYNRQDVPVLGRRGQKHLHRRAPCSPSVRSCWQNRNFKLACPEGVQGRVVDALPVRGGGALWEMEAAVIPESVGKLQKMLKVSFQKSVVVRLNGV